MKWLDDAPEDWETAPEDPPDAGRGEVGSETYDSGVLVRDADDDAEGAYIYAWEGECSLEEYT